MINQITFYDEKASAWECALYAFPAEEERRRYSTRTSITTRPQPPHLTPTSKQPVRLKRRPLGSAPCSSTAPTAI
jgi:hypothetical protein